jgi:glycosyltransferase involved in cell wall biosynthesis
MGTNKNHMKKRTVCLNMIVKDEEDTIERCMESVHKFIDSYVIVDTGSKDKTIEKIKEVGERLGIPGEVHERPWVNFAHNRTEALNLAKDKCDYRFMMDADDYLVVEGDENPFDIVDDLPSYAIKLKYGDIEYHRHFLLSSRQDWRFVGVLHEYPAYDNNTGQHGFLSGCHIRANISPLKRAKSIKAKYANDAKILEKALKDEPDNSRYWFYLAQSYRDSGQLDKSINAYKKRASMGGWQEEVYISLLTIASLMEAKSMSLNSVMEAYRVAWEYRPHRLEAVTNLMRLCRLNNRHVLSFTYGNMAAQNFRDIDMLFVSAPIKKWIFLDEYCMAAYYVGQPHIACENAKKLMDSDTFLEIPTEEQERLKKNFSYYESKINEAKNN